MPIMLGVGGRATYEVQQRYRYTYTQPVNDLRHRLIVVPPDIHGDQLLDRFELHVHGTDSELRWETDAFANRVCRITAPRVEHLIEFETHFRVRRSAAAVRPDLDPPLYVRQTALTQPDRQLRATAAGIRSTSGVTRRRVDGAFAWATTALEFQAGVTNVTTSAREALALGRGVCQDFAHLLLSMLRLLNVPARYVSGHLLGDGVPHAWVEALVGDEVIAYDPTHGRRAGLDYVTVAVGRDYSDVAPTSGTYRGMASGALSASKAARAVA